MSRKTKGILKKIGLVALGVGAVGAVALGAKTACDYMKNDLHTIHPTFEVGALGNDGEYVDADLSLYTKKDFNCDGLQTKLDFDSNISYQFYYYDYLGRFLESSDVLTSSNDFNVPINAKTARCVITPIDDEDGKISLTERITYPSQMEIRVNKKQDRKFTEYDNFLLSSVDNVANLQFVSGYTFSEVDGSYYFKENIFDCATSTCFLEIGNEKKLNFNSSKLSGYEGTPLFSVIEFTDVPSHANINPNGSNIQWSNSSITLHKDTKYILICVSISGGHTISANDVSNMNLLFNLSK